MISRLSFQVTQTCSVRQGYISEDPGIKDATHAVVAIVSDRQQRQLQSQRVKGDSYSYKSTKHIMMEASKDIPPTQY